MKGQSSLEYLVLLVVVLAIAGVASYLMVQGSASSSKSGLEAGCRAVAESCRIKALAGGTCLTECLEACVDEAGKDIFTGNPPYSGADLDPNSGAYKCSRGIIP